MEALLLVVVAVQSVALWAISVGQNSTYRSFLRAVKAADSHEFAMLERQAQRRARRAERREPPVTPFGL